ncbi:MAG TPA: hypothetical protein PK069_07310 [Methanolinea sp.]|nr:hypothetical protein [Methanolinea sp.]HQK56066.1 hypothetical protein [Methanolinea sp.]
MLFIEEFGEGIVENLIRQEIGCIVKANHDHDVLFDHSLAGVVQDLPEEMPIGGEKCRSSSGEVSRTLRTGFVRSVR